MNLQKVTIASSCSKSTMVIYNGTHVNNTIFSYQSIINFAIILEYFAICKALKDKSHQNLMLVI